MTITEIENTLHTLQTRHQNLDEEMLITLLTAGGWEEKIIKEAVVLFKNSQQKESIVIPPKELSPSDMVLAASTSKKDETILKTPHTQQPDIPVQKVAIPEAVIHQEIILDKTHPTPVVQSIDVEKLVEPLKIISETVPVSVPVVENIQKENIVTPTVVSPKGIVAQIVQSPPISLPSIKNDKSPLPSSKTESIQPTDIIYYNNVGQEEDIPFLKDDASDIVLKKSIEPQSLIIPPLQKASTQEIDPPENLPLKPFESTPHVWPFSKYKEVFHGDIMPPLPEGERALVNQIIIPKENEEHFAKKIKIKRSGFDGEDEGLIFLTGTTLLIILLLLAYMYSNGRL